MIKPINLFLVFSVGITVGPAFNTVGSLSHFHTPGYKLGLSMEYRLNSNFALSVGINYAKIRYTANGQEYDAPYGFWTNGIVPQKATAVCAVIDIPIRVKYNFYHFNRSRFYVTGGVSSYIMLHEAYQFDYARQNDSGLVQKWEEDTGTRHWFSNAVFSLGYEYDINPALSLRIEPFLKVPLTGVGWGNVQLFSAGSLISLNYNFQ